LDSKDALKQIQGLLAVRGYDVGPIDGLYGPKVRNAISNFQSREGLHVDGQTSKELLGKLKSAVNKDGKTSKELLKKLKSAANKGYLSFAAKSDEDLSNDSTCRSYGGQPIVGQHYKVVMESGRADHPLYNVIYYGGHRYVLFKIDASTSILGLLGFKTHDFGLCQF
jgi:peptidoglycan hydrolase-like protein with peptidoglycan-binding domain